MLSDSVFGDDYHFQNGLLPPNQFRPLSVLSISSIHSPMKEYDTMISVCPLFSLSVTMFINNDMYYRCSEVVRRRPIRSLVEASPCVRIEKRKHSAAQEIQIYNRQDDYDSPNGSNRRETFNRLHILISIRWRTHDQSSTRSFGTAKLEDNCLSADGEEKSGVYEFFLPVSIMICY
jgi:serine/arginine repetitive matrix protein 2